MKNVHCPCDWMVGNLEQTQEERLLGLVIDPSLSWSSHVTRLKRSENCISLGGHQYIQSVISARGHNGLSIRTVFTDRERSLRSVYAP